jgi:NitT/TauT family transport system permease protein
VEGASSGVDEGDRQESGGAVKKYVMLWRVLIILAFILMLEVLCRIRVIDPFTMQAPSKMIVDLWNLLVSGKYNGAIAKTMSNAATAFVLSVTFGIAAAVVIHRIKTMREALDPLFATYYAIPVLAFYPLLIVLLGLGDAPKIAIGFMLSVIAVIANTLNGLDRVPRVLLKTARIVQMTPIETALRVTLPSAAPYLLTGIKVALAYSLVGIIGSEFIMSSNGMGFEIAFAYNNYDNATMYPLIVLILIISITLNVLVSKWESIILSRRGLR